MSRAATRKNRRKEKRRKMRPIREAFVLNTSRTLLDAKMRLGVSAGEIAQRLGWDVMDVHNRLTSPEDLDQISDLAFAMGFELRLDLRDKRSI